LRRGRPGARLGIAAIAALFVLSVPGAAFGQGVTITPTRFDDPPPGPAGCVPSNCSLRQAVESVSGSTPVTILLQAGTYALTRGLPLELQSADVVTINGADARATAINATNLSRIFYLQEGSTATINGVTITGGNASVGQQPALNSGGGIYVQGAATLILSRSSVVGNVASLEGGGIWTGGQTEISDSTISDNQAPGLRAMGGGIFSDGGNMVLRNVTVSGNTAAGLGGGIHNLGPLQTQNVTIAGNQAPTGSGYYEADFATSPPRTFENTIVIADSAEACAGTTALITGDHNIDDDGTCGFSAFGDKPGVNPLLGPLRNNGGHTDTQALAAGSPAINAGDPANCPATDQRGVTRPQGGTCDIGAFEYVPPPPPPPPPPSPPSPPPEDQLPPPVIRKAVNVLPKSGTVRIKRRGQKRFVKLTQGQQIPLGSIIDTRKGRVTLVAAADNKGKTATADFYEGLFKVSQTRGAKPYTTAKLTEKLSCPKTGNANTAAKRNRKRRLWGDGKGRFRTEGQYSSATVRGTMWLTQDHCDRTWTKVTRGKVAVRDFIRKKTIIVRAGKQYIARVRR